MGHDMLMLGVDAGGTSTRAVLTNAGGACLGYGVGGRGNPISAGPERAADGVLEAVQGAVASAGCAVGDIAVIAAAMAGQRASGAGADRLRDRLTAAGFTGRLAFESDLLATYFSGTAEEFGYAIVSGTGASVIRISGGRIDVASDGLGWLLGDRGSGFWIGRRIARAVVQDLDATGPETALTRGVLDHLGIPSESTRGDGRSVMLERIVDALYARPPIELASLAPLAFATEGDPVAERILRRAGEHLADSLIAVLTGPGPLVAGGGVLSRPGAVRDAFMRRLGAAAVGLDLRPVVDGVIGAGVLALRAGGVPTTDETLATLTATLARFR